MTDVLTIKTPDGPRSPAVFDSPHSGSDYPEDFGSALDVAILRRFEDPYVDRLYQAAPDLGAPLLSARFPRTYVDVNRSLEDLDPEMVDGAWPFPIESSRKVERGVGLIWRRARQYGEIYDRLLPVDEVECRIDKFWRPYHSAIARLIDDAHIKHGVSYHVNCHSMTSRGDDYTPDGPGQRPDFILGDLDGTSCEPGFTDLVASTLRDRGHSVAVNFPYRGAELTRAYANPGAGRHSLQIEVNQGLYLTEDISELTDGFQPLQDTASRLIETIIAYAVDQAKSA